MKYFILALSLVLGTSVMAQDQPATPKTRKPTKERPAMPEGGEPGRTMKPSRGAGKLAASYADSNEFNKAFLELYAVIKPKVTIEERAQKIFLQTARSFARTGVDSATAYEAVMKSVNPKLDYELIYMTYRTQLSAEELQGWVNFLKTPAGKKILEVGDKLLAADDKLIETQVRRSVNTAIAPLRQPKAPKTQVEGNQYSPNGAGAASGAATEVESAPVQEKK
jgi:hypothetical protein